MKAGHDLQGPEYYFWNYSSFTFFFLHFHVCITPPSSYQLSRKVSENVRICRRGWERVDFSVRPVMQIEKQTWIQTKEILLECFFFPFWFQWKMNYRYFNQIQEPSPSDLCHWSRQWISDQNKSRNIKRLKTNPKVPITGHRHRANRLI